MKHTTSLIAFDLSMLIMRIVLFEIRNGLLSYHSDQNTSEKINAAKDSFVANSVDRIKIIERRLIARSKINQNKSLRTLSAIRIRLMKLE